MEIMKSKRRVNEGLILAAAVFSPVYFMTMQQVEKYKIDTGHLGRAIVELVTIPALIMPLFIFGYCAVYMVLTKKCRVLLVISMICSALVLGGFVTGLFMDAAA